MDRLAHKSRLSAQRAKRVRTKISGTKDRPRLRVNFSNAHVSVQLIDDSSGNTLANATTVGQKLSGNMTEKAAKVGKEIAEQANKAGIKQVVFDRGSKLYHGRVKALAEAAREAGLEF